MKVFYFTFLVLFFIPKVFAVNCFDKCGSPDKSTSAFMCFTSCTKANNQNNTTSKTTTYTAPKTSTTVKKSTSKQAATPNPSGASSEDSAKSRDEGLATDDPRKPECLMNHGDWDSERKICTTFAEKRMLECTREDKTWNESTDTCEPSSSPSTVSSSESYNCIEQFNKMKDQCVSEASSAMTSCNDNNEEMQAAETTAKLIGAGSVTSMQVACSKIADLSKFANGALGVWKTACATNQGGCTESCTEAKRLLDIECIEQAPKDVLKSTFYKPITDNINQCESYKEKIAQATQHAAAALAQLKASEQCKDDTSANLVKNAVDQCKANPNSPLCKDLQKCSDANFAAQNPVCACASNPTSAACLQASANYGNGGTNAMGTTLPGVKGGKDITGVSGLNGAGSENGQAALGTNSAPGMDGQSVGGRQGDASSAGNVRNGGGGAGGGAGNHYAGGGNEKDPLKVNSGTLGGAPGGMGGFFGRTTASSGGNPNALNANRGDIAKFDPRKYITGMGGKGEYINGANQNIFAIVKMRYEDKKPSMLPENFNLKK